MRSHTEKEARWFIDEYIYELTEPLRELNRKIHEHPELAYEEQHAHDTICDFLTSQGIPVKRLPMDFATPSKPRVTAFVIDKFGLPGQAKPLGTPAEEDGGGKIDLIAAGAYKDVDVSMMVHPVPDGDFLKRDVLGITGRSSSACFDITAIYRGVSAHAAASPWEGVNALDALISAYNNISMLRQQIAPDERVHGAILRTLSITNAIPELTRTKYTVRGSNEARARSLGNRVRRCLEAGALATGCRVDIEESKMYADLLVNTPLCEGFQKSMRAQGVSLDANDEIPMAESTDQGNVSQVVQALHALIGIIVKDGAGNNTRQFTEAAGTDETHRRMIKAVKAMAMLGWQLLTDDEYYGKVRNAFAEAKAESSTGCEG